MSAELEFGADELTKMTNLAIVELSTMAIQTGGFSDFGLVSWKDLGVLWGGLQWIQCMRLLIDSHDRDPKLVDVYWLLLN